jgi:hypothetical protein
MLCGLKHNYMSLATTLLYCGQIYVKKNQVLPQYEHHNAKDFLKQI